MSENYKRTPNVKCDVCGKSVYKRPAQIKANHGHIFCSIECYGVSCRKEHPCVICGKPILASAHKKTCGRSCANINRTGIKYHLGRPKDKVKNQRSIKLKLIADRGKNCERCGYGKLEILQVHHKDRDRLNNDLSNLELICPNCHFEEHYAEKSWLKQGVI